MERQLREKLIYILEKCKEGSPFGADYEDFDIYRLLQYEGYITERPNRISYTSLTGREYLECLKAPTRAWLKDNWFPTAVAAATILFAGVSAGVQLTSLLTSGSGS